MTKVVMVTRTFETLGRRGENQAEISADPEIVGEPHEINLHRGVILEIA